VPAHLRDGSYAGAKQLGHGVGYRYSHDSPDAFVPQAYLPDGRRFYEPGPNGEEKRVAERLATWREEFARWQEAEKKTSR
jgi:putative ATPase